MDRFSDCREQIPLFIDHIRKNRGIDLSGYRLPTLARRTGMRMQYLGISSLKDYLVYLKRNNRETDLLLDSILVNTSCFFRDPIVYEYIWREILSGICMERHDPGDSPVSIWSCGCSTGEEAYSMAILVKDLPARGLPPLTAAIFGTDIDKDALKIAVNGCYPSLKLKYAQLGHVGKYFRAEKDKYCVTPEIRQMVSFSVHDVLASGRKIPRECVFRNFDIILCRNLLIYMDPETQISILRDLERSLSPGGYLVLGEAESLHGNFGGKLEQVPGNCRIYKKIY